MTSALACLVMATFAAGVNPPVVPIDPARIPVLLRKLEAPTYTEKFPNGDVRWRYYLSSAEWEELAYGGPVAAEALAAFATDGTNPTESRAEATGLLCRHLSGYFSEPTGRAVRALAATLADKNPAIRRAAAESITALGFQHARSPDQIRPVHAFYRNWFSTAAVPPLTAALVALVGDRDADVCVSGCRALYAIDAVGAAIPELVAAAQRHEPAVRANAVRTLGVVGNTDAGALKVVLKALDPKNDPDVHFAAIHAIGRFGPDARDAIPELTRIVKEFRVKDGTSSQSVTTAVESLGRIGVDARPALPAILARMIEPEFGYQYTQLQFRLAVMRIDVETGTKLEHQYQRLVAEWRDKQNR